MVSISEALFGQDESIRALEKAMAENESNLKKLDELEARLKANRVARDSGSRTVSDSRTELAAIRSEVKQVQTYRVATSSADEIRAADELAEALEKGGLRLKRKLPSIAQAELNRKGATTNSLRNKLAEALLEEAGGMATPMGRFLGESIGEFGKFAAADYGIVYGSADDMVAKIVQFGAQYAGEYSGNLSRFVLDQVDRTQDASRFIFTRHVESGGCSWCRAQVAAFESTGKFLRHTNCRCMKVRR